MVDLKPGDRILYKTQRGDGTIWVGDYQDHTQVIWVVGLGHCGSGTCSGLLKKDTDFHGIAKTGLRNLTFKGVVKVLPGGAEFLTIKTKI